jgi:hypothetical protein
LKSAGIAAIQPGIESLSTVCLKLMNKGVSARQNISLLRYARSVDISVGWNILYGIPGDKIEEYQHMLDILPLLHHLHPPIGLSFISIERFSPYFTNPSKYNISNIRPMNFYSSVMPDNVDISRIAYHFFADYRSESREHPDLIHSLKEEIDRWRSSWRQGVVPPVLVITDIGYGHYLLIDTRGLSGTQELNFLTEEQALIALAGANQRLEDEVEWALRRKLLVEVDSKYIPLAIAQPELFMKFEEALRH